MMEGYVIIALKSIAVYVFIVAAIRVFGKKEFAQLSVVDVVFILLISNSVQTAMVGDDTSLSGGLVAALATGLAAAGAGATAAFFTGAALAGATAFFSGAAFLAAGFFAVAILLSPGVGCKERLGLA